MAGRKQWLMKSVSINDQVTTVQTWFGGYEVRSAGNSTPSTLVIRNGSTGAVVLNTGLINSGAGAGTGTIGDSTGFQNIDRPALLGNGLYISIGSAQETCIGTVLYKEAVN